MKDKMIKKEMCYPLELKAAIQEYADLHTNGVFNVAVRELIAKGLLV